MTVYTHDDKVSHELSGEACHHTRKRSFQTLGFRRLAGAGCGGGGDVWLLLLLLLLLLLARFGRNAEKWKMQICAYALELQVRINFLSMFRREVWRKAAVSRVSEVECMCV